MKKIVDLYLILFRRSFLKRIKKRIKNKDVLYCCNVYSYHIKWLSFKDLPEVKEAFRSIRMDPGGYGIELNPKEKLKTEFSPWFPTDKDRLSFIELCLEINTQLLKKELKLWK